MIGYETKVRIISECYWMNSRGRFLLLGLEGSVYDVDDSEYGVEVGVLLPHVGHVMVSLSEIEVMS